MTSRWSVMLVSASSVRRTSPKVSTNWIRVSGVRSLGIDATAPIAQRRALLEATVVRLSELRNWAFGEGRRWSSLAERAVTAG